MKPRPFRSLRARKITQLVDRMYANQRLGYSAEEAIYESFSFAEYCQDRKAVVAAASMFARLEGLPLRSLYFDFSAGD